MHTPLQRKKIRFIPTCCGLCPHCAWTIFCLQAGASTAIYIWLSFVSWFWFFWEMICDKWQWIQYCSPAQTMEFHTTAWTQFSSLERVHVSCISCWTLFWSCFWFCFNIFKKLQRFKPKLSLQIWRKQPLYRLCPHKVFYVCHRRYFTHLFLLLKCTNDLCLLVFISWYCLYVHGHYWAVCGCFPRSNWFCNFLSICS